MSVDVADGHVTHEEDEAEPWHVWSLDVGGDEIGADCVDQNHNHAAPEIEETDQVEDGDARMFSLSCGPETEANVLRDIEDILDLRSIIGQSLENAGKGVREEKGDDELDCSQYQTLSMLRSTVDLRSSVEAPRALARYSKATWKSIWALKVGTIGRLTSVDVGQHREIVVHRWFLGRYPKVFHVIVS